MKVIRFDPRADLISVVAVVAGRRPPATVRLALTGAAKMPEEAIRRLQDRFDLRLAEGYGLTEASPVVTSLRG